MKRKIYNNPFFNKIFY